MTKLKTIVMSTAVIALGIGMMAVPQQAIAGSALERLPFGLEIGKVPPAPVIARATGKKLVHDGTISRALKQNGVELMLFWTNAKTGVLTAIDIQTIPKNWKAIGLSLDMSPWEIKNLVEAQGAKVIELTEEDSDGVQDLNFTFHRKYSYNFWFIHGELANYRGFVIRKYVAKVRLDDEF